MTADWPERTAEPSPVGETSRTAVTFTLSLLPILVGGVAVAATLVGAVLAGVTDGRQGWPLAVLAAVLVAATVVDGSSFGLAGAWAVLAVVGLAGRPTTTELVALIVTLLVVNETVRFSLDARRPTRFGPGLVARYLWRTASVGLVLAGYGVMATSLVGRAPASDVWIPIGIGAAAVPLFVLPAAERLRHPRLQGPLPRAAIAVALTTAALTVVTIGAQARNDLRSPSAAPAPSPTTTVPAPTTTTAAPDRSPGESDRTPEPWMAAVAIGVILALVYLMLRRPEALSDLEEVEAPGEARSFELGLAGVADAEATVAPIDETTLAHLLERLQLDIAAEPDPGRAIRFGYATIEQRLAEVGLERTGSETEGEFLARALPSLGSAAAAMTVLTGLFERARFDHRPIDEAMRRRALDAIEELVLAIAELKPARGSDQRVERGGP